MGDLHTGMLDLVHAAIGDDLALALLASNLVDRVAVLSTWLLGEVLFQNGDDAVLLCDAAQRVMHFNQAARDLPSTCGAIGRDNRLAFASRATQTVFCAAVEQAARRRIPTTFRVERLAKLPCQVDVGTIPAVAPVVVVTIVDLEKQLCRRIESAKRLYLFTPSECALAESLMLGRTPEEHAVSRGTTVSTVRSQLHVMFAKSNTRRQGELIALLSR